MNEKRKMPGGQAIRILVVEDSPLNRQVALMQLEKLGCEAKNASNLGGAQEV